MALSGAALAQSEAYTNEPVDLYAGPAADYPLVAQVPPGEELTVMGCVDGYSWCDVATPEFRGWAYGGYLSYPYQGTEVPIATYGVQIGLPIVTFVIGDYWGRYYHGRPWFRDRDRWANHPLPVRGGPSPHAGPPPHGEPPRAGGPTVNPRLVIHGGPSLQPQPGYIHGPGQPPAHVIGEPPAHLMGEPPAGQAPRPGGPPAPQRGSEPPRGGGEERGHQSNH
jgi:uncharacterized protein YraI